MSMTFNLCVQSTAVWKDRMTEGWSIREGKVNGEKKYEHLILMPSDTISFYQRLLYDEM